VTEEFLRAHGLTATSDDRPFHFDVDPSHAELRRAYSRTLILFLLLVPFVLALWVRQRAAVHFRLAQLLVVVLTGMAYLLIEVVLLQRFAIFLGSPLVTFTAVLATLLAGSGLGSLWSGRLGDRGAAIATAMLLVLLLIHAWLVPSLLTQGVRLPLAAKVLVTVACLAPLALLMGVPFPYVMRLGQTSLGSASAALLFAINGAASALAVPLAFNLSSAWGFGAVWWLCLALYLTVALLLAARRWARLVGPANALALALVVALLAVPWRDRWGGTAQAESAARYRIDAIRYGRSRVTEDKVFADGSRGRKRDFAWLLWLVRGNGRTVLVDTGFEDPARAQAWHISDFVRPTRRLQQLGIAPEQVTDVILTHAHWDHMGGIAAYPRARIYVQDQEVRYAELAAAPDRSGRGGVQWKDLQALRRAADHGRVERIDGNRELFAGLSVVAGGAHTPGSQYVLVETLDGTVVLAGDAVCQHDNNVWQRPIGSSLDPAANLAAILRMLQAAASPFLILPGHEPAVMGWFPPVADGVVEISLVPHR
jgi:glyoxylase-like metal-dependent hydrolase (beta-lactamase superfamily II)